MSKVVYDSNHATAFTTVYTTSITLSVNPSAVKNASFIYNPLELPQALTCTVTSVTIVKRVLVSIRIVCHVVPAVVLVYTTVSIQ